MTKMTKLHIFIQSFVAFMTVVILAGCGPEITDVPQAVIEDKKLAGLANACPSDLMPLIKTGYNNQHLACEASQSSCFKKCRRGDANACLDLANIYVLEDKTYSPSQLLFKRACQLGLPSGCTNAAAGLLSVEESKDGACMLSSFEKTCASGDSWGCTMQAILLSDKRFVDVVERDFDAALKALEGSCKPGYNEEACSAAEEIGAMIREFIE